MSERISLRSREICRLFRKTFHLFSGKMRKLARKIKTVLREASANAILVHVDTHKLPSDFFSPQPGKLAKMDQKSRISQNA